MEKYLIKNVQNKIDNGQIPIGTHIGTPSPYNAEILAGCGFDMMWIDAEHSALDRKDIQDCLMACRAADVPGIVRVPWNDHVAIKGVLDMGADGVIIPMIRNYEEAKQAVAATLYPADGIRGMGLRRAANYGLWDKDEYVNGQYENIWTILQIEDVNVIPDLERIMEIPGINSFVIGPNDFAMSMCRKGEKRLTPADPEVKEKFDEIGEILSKGKIPFGVSSVYSDTFMKEWLSRGAKWFCMNFDFHYLVQGGKTLLANAESTLKEYGK